MGIAIKYWLFLKKECTNVRGRLKGSTLIETLVAMTILLTIISIFFLQISKINESINPQIYYKAFLISNKLLLEKNIPQDNSEFILEGFKITTSQTIQKQANTKVIVITISFLNGHKILENRKIISNRIEI